MRQVIARYLLDAADHHRFPVTALVPIWARFSRATRRKPHSLLVRLCDRLAYDLPATVHLENGLTMRVYWTDLGVGQRLLTTGTHEPETIAVLKRLLRPGMTIFDIGAQVGQYTLEAAKLVGAAGAVHAFEPEPRNVALLRDNCATNHFDNITVSPVALSDRQETRSLHLAVSRNAGAHSFAPSEIASGHTVDVRCTTLDDYCRESATAPDIVKIDVEGFELSVLNGGRSTLRSAAPILIIEFNDYNQSLFGHSCNELSAFLRDELHYTLVRIDTPEPMTPSPAGVDTYFNVLAVPADQLDSVLHSLQETNGPLVPDPRFHQWELLTFLSAEPPHHDA